MSRYINRPTARAWGSANDPNRHAHHHAPRPRPQAAPGAGFAKGVRVAYARRWILATRAHEQARWRGVITEWRGDGLAQVLWDGQPVPMLVLMENLVREDRLALEAY